MSASPVRQPDDKDTEKKPFSKAKMLWMSAAWFAMNAAIILLIANKPEQPEPVKPEYTDMPAPQAAALVKRINNMAANFAEHYSGCTLGFNDTERYLKTHKIVSSLADAALLKSVDGETFANDLEHAMLKEVRIIPSVLPPAILGVFYDNADNGKDVLVLQKDVIAVYGAVPKLFNYLSQKNFDTQGQTVVLSSKGKGEFEVQSFTNPDDIKINDQQMASSLAPRLRFSQPCNKFD